MKVLIIRFSAIGDIVWTSPVIRGLKEQIPGLELHYCTKYQYRSMMSHNPYLDKVHYLKDSLRQLTTQLQQEKFDYIIDLHKNLRTAWIKFRLGVKAFSYRKLTWERWLFINFKINRMPPVHVADRYMDTVKPLGVEPDGKGLDYFIAQKDEVSLDSLPEIYQDGYVALVIGASEPTKKLPIRKLKELCHKINHPIILIGGQEDHDTAEQLIQEFRSPRPIPLYNACGSYNISQSASLVKQADLVFGHDTGLTHIAAAFKKKTYAIFGSTSPLGFHPYQTDYAILENKSLNCRPCSKSGRRVCPKKHFKCMREIEFDFDISRKHSKRVQS